MKKPSKAYLRKLEETSKKLDQRIAYSKLLLKKTDKQIKKFKRMV